MTTGATAAACARALKRAGRGTVTLLTLARVDRRLMLSTPQFRAIRISPGDPKMPSLDRLHKPVLVLNASYEPINICAARRALVLVLKGVASAEEESQAHVHSRATPSACRR